MKTRFFKMDSLLIGSAGVAASSLVLWWFYRNKRDYCEVLEVSWHFLLFEPTISYYLDFHAPLTDLRPNWSGFHGSFRRDLGSAQAITRECKSAFVISVHI